VYNADQDDVVAGDSIEPDSPPRVGLVQFRNGTTHELVDRTADMSHKLLDGDWVTVWRLVPRLELTFPLIVTGPIDSNVDGRSSTHANLTHRVD